MPCTGTRWGTLCYDEYFGILLIDGFVFVYQALQTGAADRVENVCRRSLLHDI